MNLASNDRQVLQFMLHPEKWSGDGISSADRVRITRIVDAYFVPVQEIALDGLKVTPFGLVVRRYAMDASRKLLRRGGMHRVRGQMFLAPKSLLAAIEGPR